MKRLCVSRPRVVHFDIYEAHHLRHNLKDASVVRSNIGDDAGCGDVSVGAGTLLPLLGLELVGPSAHAGAFRASDGCDRSTVGSRAPPTLEAKDSRSFPSGRGLRGGREGRDAGGGAFGSSL